MTTSTTLRGTAALATAGAVLLGGAACASTSEETDGDKAVQTVHVAAAASLTDVFTELGKSFEAAHPGTRIVFDFGSSTTLATQLPQRSDVSLYASADGTSMKSATDSGAAHDPVTLAVNRLVIAVPKGNPAGIATLADLDNPDRTVVLCDATAPCGRASTRVLHASHLAEPARANRQPDVRATLGVVTAGEADAGLVYKTDAESAKGKVEAIALDPAIAKAGDTEYFLAPVGRDVPQTAKDFQAYILGADGMAVLIKAGFTAPAK